MRKKPVLLVAFAVLAFLATAGDASAVQGICVECQVGWSGKFYCYYINRSGWQDCWVSGGGYSCSEAGYCWVD